MLGTGEVPEIVSAIGGAATGVGRGRRCTSSTVHPRHLHARPGTARHRAPRPRTPAPAANLHLRRRHAAAARHAAPLRLHEDRRRLRLQVRVLHHPDAARRTTVAGPPSRSCARPGAGRARRQGAAAHLAGHDLLRHRSRRARRARAAAARAERGGRLEWIRLLYLYPTTIDDDMLDAMAECDKVCKYIDLPLQHASDPVLKRMKRPGTRAEATSGCSTASARGCRASRCARRSSSGSRARPRPTSTSSCGFVERPRVRPRRRVHLLPRGGHDGHELDDDVPAAKKTARRKRIMRPAEAARPRRAEARDRRAGPVAGGRTGGRPRSGAARPAGDPGARHRRLVYLTECDPSSLPRR